MFFLKGGTTMNTLQYYEQYRALNAQLAALEGQIHFLSDTEQEGVLRLHAIEVNTTRHSKNRNSSSIGASRG